MDAPSQEMEDAALQVMEAARAAEALLGKRAAALAAVTAEHERKQAEARPPRSCTCWVVCSQQ